jgi:hypothetical protein
MQAQSGHQACLQGLQDGVTFAAFNFNNHGINCL